MRRPWKVYAWAMWSVDVEQVADWLASLDDRSYEQVFAAIELLQERGPQLGRPMTRSTTTSAG